MYKKEKRTRKRKRGDFLRKKKENQCLIKVTYRCAFPSPVNVGVDSAAAAVLSETNKMPPRLYYRRARTHARLKGGSRRAAEWDCGGSITSHARSLSLSLDHLTRAYAVAVGERRPSLKSRSGRKSHAPFSFNNSSNNSK